ncbi:hypothetical protein CLV40_10846 [Actinokineospora auranticolor]|uniref:Uncharacterized protein n=1 Tax=Actinokineospora auranticolor TaxID=155976 RepID=A0A2S6GPA2_9PSEU|nr:hypothetical protein CLV40_10846 [Actinokineospora auranticolor]
MDDSTCGLTKGNYAVRVMLSSGPGAGLGEVPPLKGARVSDLRIGVFPARKEVLGSSCAIAVELVPGRVLRVQYWRKDFVVGSECMWARDTVKEALTRLIYP